MDSGLILTIDCGTQSTRALLFNVQGEMLAKTKVDVTPYISNEAGQAEQHLSFCFDKLSEATSRLKSENPSLWGQIKGVAVTTIRDTFVCVDDNIKELSPMIVWLDQRLAQYEMKDLPLFNRLCFALVGMTDAVRAQIKKCFVNWIKKNQPDIWDKTYKYLSYSAYIVHCLTGRLLDSSASQVGHIPFNYRKKRWNVKGDLNKCMFDVPNEKLIELAEPTSILGHVTAEASKLTGIPEGLPVIAAASDKCCESLGVGCLDDTTAALSFGTAASIQVTTKKYIEPIAFMPAYPSAIPDRFNPEIQIYRGFWMVNWFKNQFSEKEKSKATEAGVPTERILDEYLDTIPAGSDGLILQPFWSPVLKAPEGKGAIIGFNDVHTNAHIYKSIIEGVCYGLYDGMKAIERKVHHRIKYVAASGGGSASNAVCQLTADVFGLPVKRVQTFETSGLGAAIIAFVGLGVYGSFEDAVKNMVHYKDEFIPNVENHNLYDTTYKNVYKKMYCKLKGLYRSIDKIYDRAKKN